MLNLRDSDKATKLLDKIRQLASLLDSILDRYDVARQYVVVMGDMNEDTRSAFGSLHPLLQKMVCTRSSTRLYRSTSVIPIITRMREPGARN